MLDVCVADEDRVGDNGRPAACGVLFAAIARQSV